MFSTCNENKIVELVSDLAEIVYLCGNVQYRTWETSVRIFPSFHWKWKVFGIRGSVVFAKKCISRSINIPDTIHLNVKQHIQILLSRTLRDFGANPIPLRILTILINLTLNVSIHALFLSEYYFQESNLAFCRTWETFILRKNWYGWTGATSLCIHNLIIRFSLF